MKRILAGALACLSISATAFADPRSDAINAAQNLATETARLSNYVSRACNCPNTAYYLSEMSERAGDLELTARFGTRLETIRDLRPVVQTAIELRNYVQNIQDPQLRLTVKRTYLNSLNEVGRAVDTGWVIVRACPVQSFATRSCDEEALFDGIADGMERNAQPKHYENTPEF